MGRFLWRLIDSVPVSLHYLNVEIKMKDNHTKYCFVFLVTVNVFACLSFEIIFQFFNFNWPSTLATPNCVKRQRPI